MLRAIYLMLNGKEITLRLQAMSFSPESGSAVPASPIRLE